MGLYNKIRIPGNQRAGITAAVNLLFQGLVSGVLRPTSAVVRTTGNVAFERHLLLAHDLHETLRPDLRADLSADVRSDQELFEHWWKRKDS